MSARPINWSHSLHYRSPSEKLAAMVSISEITKDIATVLLYVLCPCIWIYRRRRARRGQVRLRRKEVEEYEFNSNNDPQVWDDSQVCGVPTRLSSAEPRYELDDGYRGSGIAERNEWRSVKAAVNPKPVSTHMSQTFGLWRFEG